MTLTYSTTQPIGSLAPDFLLKGTDGKIYSLNSFKDSRVLVIVFTCNHCPYAKASEDRLAEIQRDYASRGVQLVFINSNDSLAYSDDSFEKMIEQAEKKQFPFPYLHDETQRTALAYGAVCTPDVFVFDDHRRLTYHGRIDDNWQDPSKISRHDLRSAIDATLNGKPIDFSSVPSMGCNIKWKSL